MVIVKTVDENILKATQPFIAHQCNCVTTKSHGLSLVIFTEFEFANVYKRRIPFKKGGNSAQIPDKPGTIDVSHSNIGGVPSIISMFAQYAPGKSGSWKFAYPSTEYEDTSKDRLKWFKRCLLEIESQGITDVAIPNKIGCGLGGGNWVDYLKLLKDSPILFTIYNYKS